MQYQSVALKAVNPRQLLDGDWSASVLTECFTVSYCWKNAYISINISAHCQRFGSPRAFIRSACATCMVMHIIFILRKSINALINKLINYIIKSIHGMLQSVASMLRGAAVTLGFIPEGCEVPRVLIHLLVRILWRHGPRLYSWSITVTESWSTYLSVFCGGMGHGYTVGLSPWQTCLLVSVLHQWSAPPQEIL